MHHSITKKSKALWTGAGVTLLLLLWYGLAKVNHGLIVPSPGDTWTSLVALFESGKLQTNVSITLLRLFWGLVIGLLSGLILGVVAGIFRGFSYLMKPFLTLLFGLPPVVIVVLAMLWFGMGSSQTIFVVAIMVFPTVFISAMEGIQSVDEQLLEMAGTFQASTIIKWVDVYLPALATAILTGFSLAAGMAIRIAVMAELLGTSDGIGYAITIARTNLDTAQLFAWILVCLLLVASMEFLFVKPVRKYLMRWKVA